MYQKFFTAGSTKSLCCGVMKNIIKMIENFKIKRFCETIYGYNPHSAIIGGWVRWWLKDSRLGEKRERRVINPAIGMTYRKKRVFADLLFAEQARRDSYFFKVLGVAEVENNSSRFLEKLRALSLYEQLHKEREDRKFPDLKFNLLCCKTTRKRVDQKVMDEADLIEKLVKESEMCSRNSDLRWILYFLKYTRVETDYSFRVQDYVQGYQQFWYSSSFFGSEFYIHKDGKLLAHSQYEY